MFDVRNRDQKKLLIHSPISSSLLNQPNPPPLPSHTHSSSDVLWELSTEYQSMSDPAMAVHFLIEITIQYDREMNGPFGRELYLYNMVLLFALHVCILCI